MKQLLFVITSFRHGGTNKSLENLLSLIDTKKFEVDVFAMEHYGPYITMLPNCTILRKDIWLHGLIAQYNDTSGYTKLLSLILKILRKLTSLFNYNFTDYFYKKRANRIVKNKTYDTVIAFSEGVPTAFVKHFYHQNKLAWIHCDYASYMQLNDYPDERAIYESYKFIVCVSEYTKVSFCKVIPSACAKVHAIHNIVNVKAVHDASKENQNETYSKNGTFNILSVGRVDEVKRFNLIPQIARMLLDRNCKFKWYLIGPEGQPKEQSELEGNIIKYHVEDTFFLLGEKNNPYPFIKSSDLVVILSISEACPYVVSEAKVLHIPLVCTNFGSVHEFVQNEVNGFISPIEDIAVTIEMLIKDKAIYKNLKSKVELFSYNNNNILYKIENIL